MYKLDINKGDIMLRGKYRNQKETVKTFGHDDKGQPTINGKRILTFNIEKLLPKKEIKETMNKSELIELIKECILEEGILEEGPADDDANTAKKIKAELERSFDAIEGAMRVIEEDMSSFNAPGLKKAYQDAIKSGLKGKIFSSGTAKATLNKYFKR